MTDAPNQSFTGSEHPNYNAMANGPPGVLRDLAIEVMSQQTGSRRLMALCEAAIAAIQGRCAAAQAKAVDRAVMAELERQQARGVKYLVSVNVNDLVAAICAALSSDAAQAAPERGELEMLRERLGPRGLEVVEIEGAGHYVNEKVKAEIERLRGIAYGAWKPDRIAVAHAIFKIRSPKNPNHLTDLYPTAQDEYLRAADAVLALSSTEGK